MYKSAVIGLGKIGLLYDLKRSLHTKKTNLTHSRCLSESSFFELSAGIDPDPDTRDLFERTYSRPSFSSVEDYGLSSPKVDIVTIAVQQKIQYSVALETIRYLHPRAILLEKPFCNNIEEAKALAEFAARHSTLLYINYPRLCEPSLDTLRKLIANGLVKGFCNGTFYFTRGIRNSASHFISLLNFLFDSQQHFPAVNKYPNTPHGTIGHFQLLYHRAKIEMHHLEDHPSFTNQALLVFENCHILLEDACSKITLHWYDLSTDYAFDLTESIQQIPTDYSNIQKHTYNSLYLELQSQHSTSLCNAESALDVERVLDLL